MSKTCLSFSHLSLFTWFLLGFDTLTIMHTNSSSFFPTSISVSSSFVLRLLSCAKDDDFKRDDDFDDDEKEEEKDEKI